MGFDSALGVRTICDLELLRFAIWLSADSAQVSEARSRTLQDGRGRSDWEASEVGVCNPSTMVVNADGDERRSRERTDLIPLAMRLLAAADADISLPYSEPAALRPGSSQGGSAPELSESVPP